MIRKAEKQDLEAVAAIYDALTEIESGSCGTTGWKKGIYPTLQTAKEAYQKQDLFVMIKEGKIVASARLNQEQVPEYADCNWRYPVPSSQVMVLHTLTIDPAQKGKGYGTEFEQFYEAYALEKGCHYLRIDTNEINQPARHLYRKLGYEERGIVPCVFNGITGVRLVCLEKRIGIEE